MVDVRVPRLDGTVCEFALTQPTVLDTATSPSVSRVAYAAAHVVPAGRSSASGERIDWDATMRLRHRLWSMGLGVAESMDTSQRGMGLTPGDALRLGEYTIEEARAVQGRVVVGVGTDDLPEGPAPLAMIRDSYLAQISRIEDAGGRPVIMASRQLAATATTADDYLDLYSSVLTQARGPVVLHWLGSMFDPALRGYWGVDSPAGAVGTVRDLIIDHAAKVDGIKVSVLDPSIEIALREAMPGGVRTYTGDDYNYVDLIAGDSLGHSDALLGAFAAVAPFASAALKRLDDGDAAGYRSILAPTERLSRLVFAAPTQYYKVGVAWLAWLEGLQDEFRMLDGFESNRSAKHLGEVVWAADQIGYFSDPDATADRVNGFFADGSGS